MAEFTPTQTPPNHDTEAALPHEQIIDMQKGEPQFIGTEPLVVDEGNTYRAQMPVVAEITTAGIHTNDEGKLEESSSRVVVFHREATDKLPEAYVLGGAFANKDTEGNVTGYEVFNVFGTIDLANPKMIVGRTPTETELARQTASGKEDPDASITSQLDLTMNVSKKHLQFDLVDGKLSVTRLGLNDTTLRNNEVPIDEADIETIDRTALQELRAEVAAEEATEAQEIAAHSEVSVDDAAEVIEEIGEDAVEAAEIVVEEVPDAVEQSAEVEQPTESVAEVEPPVAPVAEVALAPEEQEVPRVPELSEVFASVTSFEATLHDDTIDPEFRRQLMEVSREWQNLEAAGATRKAWEEVVAPKIMEIAQTAPDTNSALRGIGNVSQHMQDGLQRLRHILGNDEGNEALVDFIRQYPLGEITKDFTMRLAQFDSLEDMNRARLALVDSVWESDVSVRRALASVDSFSVSEDMIDDLQAWEASGMDLRFIASELKVKQDRNGGPNWRIYKGRIQDVQQIAGVIRADKLDETGKRFISHFDNFVAESFAGSRVRLNYDEVASLEQQAIVINRELQQLTRFIAIAEMTAREAAQ